MVKRLVAIAERLAAPLGVGVDLDLVRLGAEIEDPFAAVAEQHAQALLGVAPLVQHEMPLERLDVDDSPPGLVGDQLAPHGRLVDRCRHDPEVFGIEVGEDHEPVAPMIDGVLDVVGAWPHDQRRLLGIVGGDQQHLGEGLAASVDDDPLAAAAQLDVDVEPLVGLLEDQGVVGLGGAQIVAPHPVRAHRLVGGDVEQRAVVVRPRRAAPGDVVNDVGGVDAGVEVADAQRVLLAAVDVGAPGQQLLVGADVEGVDREEVLPFRLGSRRAAPHLRPRRSTGRGSGSGSCGLPRCATCTTTRRP